MRRPRASALAAAALLLLALATAAHADSIDGAWCASDGQQLTINGPAITLPSGKAVTGKCGRHEFAYQIPPGEAGAGQIIFLQLFTEDDMASYPVTGDTLGPPTPWHRCPASPKTS
ncbi:MAG: hypothetical protein U1E15_04730 [Hyphomicrobiales bacterium]